MIFTSSDLKFGHVILKSDDKESCCVVSIRTNEAKLIHDKNLDLKEIESKFAMVGNELSLKEAFDACSDIEGRRMIDAIISGVFPVAKKSAILHRLENLKEWKSIRIDRNLDVVDLSEFIQVLEVLESKLPSEWHQNGVTTERMMQVALRARKWAENKKRLKQQSKPLLHMARLVESCMGHSC